MGAGVVAGWKGTRFLFRPERRSETLGLASRFRRSTPVVGCRRSCLVRQSNAGVDTGREENLGEGVAGSPHNRDGCGLDRGNSSTERDPEKTTEVSVHVLSFDPSVKPQSSSNSSLDSTTNNVDLADLALVDVTTGAVDRVASGYRPAGYWVSPSGNEIAFTALKGIKAENSQQSVFALIFIKLPEKRLRVAAPEVFMSDGMSVSWSPDGRWLSYTTSEAGYNPSREHVPGECFLVPADGGAPRKLTLTPHPDFGRFFRGPVWAADSESLYLLGGNALGKVTVKDRAAQEIAKDPQRKLVEIVSAEVSTGFWSTDSGHSMVVRTRRTGTRQAGFFRVDLKNGTLSKLLEEKKDYGPDISAIYELDVSSDGKVVVYRSEDAQHSPDLWIADPNFQNPRRLTHINPQFDRYSFGKSQMIDYRSSDRYLAPQCPFASFQFSGREALSTSRPHLWGLDGL